MVFTSKLCFEVKTKFLILCTNFMKFKVFLYVISSAAALGHLANSSHCKNQKHQCINPSIDQEKSHFKGKTKFLSKSDYDFIKVGLR